MDEDLPLYLLATAALAVAAATGVRRGLAGWAEAVLLATVLGVSGSLPEGRDRTVVQVGVLGSYLVVSGAVAGMAAALRDPEGGLPRTLRRLGAAARVLDPRADLRTIGQSLAPEGPWRRTRRLSGRTPAVPRASLEDRLAQTAGLPDERLDVARFALEMAKESDPALDVAHYLGVIDRMVIRLGRRLEGVEDPHDRVRTINNYVYKYEGFDAEEPRASGLEHLLLHRVIDRRRGYCVSLAALYLALTRRLGLPFHGVSVPRHFLVRYEAPGVRINVETTARGASFDDAYYRVRYRIQAELESRGVYLSSLGPREVLVEMLNNRGVYHFNRGEEHLALRDFSRATDLSSSFAAGRDNLGVLHLLRGDVEAALGHLQAAVRLDPGSAAARLHLGQAYQQAGRMGRAMACFRKAQRLDPHSELARTNQGRALLRLGRVDEAVAAHREALERAPGSVYVLNNLGTALVAAGRHEEALGRFGEALRLDPGFLVARENLARLLARLGEGGAARREARRVHRALRSRLAARREDADALLSLARLAAEVEGDLEAALAHAELALRVAPARRETQEMAAELRRRAGCSARVADGTGAEGRPA
ncbi:MAG: tetratricopeptide repeat protein [Planctomycetes bacterium]|nr:tetratricopeptide repeat protein [Planctomycetota bacterium]